MDYRREVAEARRTRDRLIERATADARQVITRAAAERDVEIRRLHVEGLSAGAIAPLVGCSQSLVFELLSAERHRRYNERRREHWRHLRAVA